MSQLSSDGSDGLEYADLTYAHSVRFNGYDTYTRCGRFMRPLTSRQRLWRFLQLVDGRLEALPPCPECFPIVERTDGLLRDARRAGARARSVSSTPSPTRKEQQ